MPEVIARNRGFDIGGESILLSELTQDEQDEADSQEFDSLKAYNAADGETYSTAEER